MGSSLVTDKGIVLQQKGNKYLESETKILAKKVVLSGDVFLDTSGNLRDCRKKMENGDCFKTFPNITDFQGYLFSTTDNKVFRIRNYDEIPFSTYAIFDGSLSELGKENITNVYDSHQDDDRYHYAIILSNNTLLMGGNNNCKSNQHYFYI